MQCPKASNGEESSYLNPERERELCEERSGAVVGVQPALRDLGINTRTSL